MGECNTLILIKQKFESIEDELYYEGDYEEQLSDKEEDDKEEDKSEVKETVSTVQNSG